MPYVSGLVRRTTAVVLSAAFVTVGVAPTVVHAEARNHYYIEIGGNAAAEDPPECTHTYGYANQHLDGGIPVPVCYPASAGPWVDGSNNWPAAPGTPSFDEAVRVGYENTLKVLEQTYREDPGALFTIVGYSQGAQVGELALHAVARGESGVPRSQVNGMLYSSPMQPGTGIWAKLPKGSRAFGFTSPGPGPVKFPGVPVQRFCIKGDPACDATTVDVVGGILYKHPVYPVDGGIITQTIADDGGDGVIWN